MAYVHPMIRVRENNRFINRGCRYDDMSGRHLIEMTQNETATVKVDYTDLLDGATITASLSNNGVDATPTVNAGVVSIESSNIAGFGDLDLTVTFSDGRIRTDYLHFLDPFSWARNDYLPVPVIGLP